ncbi:MULTISPECIES: CdaR family protein [unclassified Exiguobacterium]|uniref:CdaR family protein n=1 Tax=unclassified Exiguobacterium TaxID=2644629 RepID=UPI001BE60AA6|nr:MULTISPECIES: CdaR family protein [unclassified Exiguobacterium]
MFEKWFNERWFLRIVAVLLAVMLYLMVAGSSSSGKSDAASLLPIAGQGSTTFDVPVTVNYDESQWVAYNIPTTIETTVKGPSSSLTMLRLVKDFGLSLDLEGLDPGYHRVRVTANGFGKDVEVTPKQETVEVFLDKKVTKQVPVQVALLNKNKIAEGYVVGEAQPSKQTVAVTGGAEKLQAITSIQVPIDVTGRASTFMESFNVKATDTNGNAINATYDPEQLEVTVPVYKESKTVPINVKTTGSVKKGYKVVKIVPVVTEARLYGTKEELTRIGSVDTKAISLKDLTKTTDKTIELVEPDNVTAMDPTSITVSIVVEKENAKSTTETVEERAEKTITGVPVTLNGFDESKYTIDYAETIDLVVRGSEADLASIDATDIKAVIDVTGLKEGTHGLPISYQTSKAFDVLRPDNMDVTLKTIPRTSVQTN